MTRSLFSKVGALVVALVLLFPFGNTQAQTLINPTAWTGQGTSAAGPSAFTSLPASVLPGAATVNVSQWNRDGALTNTSAGSCYNSSGWTLGGSLATAVAENADVYFTVTNSSTTELQITELYIMSQVSATGPTNAQVQYTIGSVTANYGAPISTAHTASPEDWTLTGNVCVGPGQTATFRLYAWGGTNPAGTLRINNGTAIKAYFASPVSVTASSNSPVCEGDSIKFTGGASGGVGPYTYSWSGPSSFSSTNQNTFITPATPSAAGTYTLTVTDALNCSTLAGTGTTAVTLTPAPDPFTGSLKVCIGSTTALNSSPAGGTWASGDATIASIDPLTGVVFGISTGTAKITYTAPTGCRRVDVVTVNPLPSAITGTAFVCITLTTTLSDPTPGGTWSSSDATVADIDASGIVTGITAGTATVTYTLPTGCIATRIVTVSSLPSGISGPGTVCPGATITLSNTTGGGTWSSSNTLLATAAATTGVITGVAAGTLTITYTVGAGCIATRALTVNPLPAPVTGTMVICAGRVTTLSDADGGGTWSSSDAAIASVGSATGVVFGNSAGTATMTYTLPTTCYRTATVTVNPLPAIAGPAGVCLGSTVTLSGAPTGGTWGSSNSSVASITSGGVVSGVVLGSATITYTLPTGCFIMRVQTVNPLPAVITGPALVCANGGTITLADATPGGTWSSSDATIATAGATTGVITGVVAGSVTITYTLPTTCIATTGVSVNPAPPAVITPLGDTTVCPGSFVVLTANLGAGLTYQWYQGSTPIPGATLHTYIAAISGSYRVQVTNSLGCPSFSIPRLATIDTPVASISTTGGSLHTCAGTPLTLNANTGIGFTYQWQYDGVAVPGATTSNYNAAVAGEYGVSVSNSTGCQATTTVIVTVDPSPSPLLTFSGPLTFCAGDSVKMLAATGTGYTYQWYKAAGAIIGATNSTFTAKVSDNFSVIITNGLGCTTVAGSFSVTSNPLPSAAIMSSGPLSFCTGGSVTLIATSGGGLDYQWYRNGAAISGATGATYLATASGLFRVRVTNTATGCSDFTHADSVVTLVGSPYIVPLTPAVFCWGGSSFLSTSVSGASGVQFRWLLNGTPVPGATNPTYSAAVPGSYSVEIKIAGSCVVMTSPLSVVERPLPSPVITYNASTHVLSVQSYYTSYQWYKDLAMIPGATTSTTIATGNAMYKVVVTDTNGCQSFSTGFPLTGWTGSTSGVAIVAGDDVAVYPNPASTSLFVRAPYPLNATLTTIDGRKIASFTGVTELSVDNLPDGMYMLMLYDAAGQLVKAEKVVKAGNR